MRYFCGFCGKELPQNIASKRHYTQNTMPKRMFCDRTHDAAWRKATGFYKDMSVKGRSARSAAVTKSNSVNPRRKAKEHGR